MTPASCMVELREGVTLSWIFPKLGFFSDFLSISFKGAQVRDFDVLDFNEFFIMKSK